MEAAQVIKSCPVLPCCQSQHPSHRREERRQQPPGIWDADADSFSVTGNSTVYMKGASHGANLPRKVLLTDKAQKSWAADSMLLMSPLKL